MEPSKRLKRAQELESEIKTHTGEIKAKRNVDHHRTEINFAKAQIAELLPSGCKTCRAAATKITNHLTAKGFFKRAGTRSNKRFALTESERNAVMETTMDKIFQV